MTKSPKGIEKTGVLPGHPFCIECINAYKANPEFPWMKWVGLEKGE
jgi:hypothetical protein